MTHFVLIYTSTDEGEILALAGALRGALSDNAALLRSIGVGPEGATHRLDVRLGGPLGAPFESDLRALLAIAAPLVAQLDPGGHWRVERVPGPIDGPGDQDGTSRSAR